MRRINRRQFIAGIGAAGAMGALGAVGKEAAAFETGKVDYQVGAFYFPQYHPDRINNQPHGKGWTEWDILKAGKPRFPGHRQPRVPAWGYVNEADPKVMEMKIGAAADHGVDFWIFDWYWNENFRFLHTALEHGYFGARNNHRVKFCIMWVTDNLIGGPTSRRMFDEATGFAIEEYFSHTSYFKVDGKPWFTIYDVSTLVKSLGGVDEARVALNDFRRNTKAAGFPGLHLNATPHGIYIPLGTKSDDPRKVADDLKVDSLTSYNWVNHVVMPDFPETEYEYMRDHYFEHWRKVAKEHKIPYFPNVETDWDASCRTDPSTEFKLGSYPYLPVFKNSNPAAFRKALRMTKARLDRQKGPKIVTINAWNEWTEGGYLEPDTVYGMKYLEAIRDVFGRH